MNPEHCLVEREGHVLTVTLNRPEAKNALMRMLREIDESYSEAEALEKEIEIGGPVFASKDAREGPRAFKEKRKPVFTDQ